MGRGPLVSGSSEPPGANGRGPNGAATERSPGAFGRERRRPGAATATEAGLGRRAAVARGEAGRWRGRWCPCTWPRRPGGEGRGGRGRGAARGSGEGPGMGRPGAAGRGRRWRRSASTAGGEGDAVAS